MHSIFNLRGFRSDPSETRARIAEEDSQHALNFEKGDGGVRVTSMYPDIVLAVPEDEFYKGVNAFLVGLMQEIQARLPILLAWETFDDLRALVPDRGERERYPRSPYESGAWYRSLVDARQANHPTEPS
jgi:hypothetical protein